MAVSSFEDFCTELCRLMGVPPPALAPDERGVTGFTVTCHGTRIGFVDDRRGSEPAVLMAAGLGAPAAASEHDELRMLRALLDRNLGTLAPGAPAFMRDAASGEIWLCCAQRLPQVQVHESFQMLAAVADIADAWSRHRLLDEVSGSPSTALPVPLNLLQLA